MLRPFSFAEMSDIQEIGLAAAASPEYMAKALMELFNVGAETDDRDNSGQSNSEVGVAEGV
jgi:hypothetical protein